MRAYHFTAVDSDGQAIRRDGVVIEPCAVEHHDGPVYMCHSGLHASEYVYDALHYAPGPLVRLVECENIVDRDDDKIVCRERRELARADVTRLLQVYVCDCTERVLPIYEQACPDDDRPRIALDVSRRCISGDATDDELLAAASAAAAAINATSDAWAAWAAWAARAVCAAMGAAWDTCEARAAWAAWATTRATSTTSTTRVAGAASTTSTAWVAWVDWAACAAINATSDSWAAWAAGADRAAKQQWQRALLARRINRVLRVSSCKN